MIDLHIHSEFSVDARDTPEAVVVRAVERGLAALSLTEHEGIGSFPRARQKARELGIEYINGIEISASIILDKVRVPVDLLGYFYRDEAPAIRRMLEGVHEHTRLDATAFLSGLAALEFPVPRAEIERQCAGHLSSFAICRLLDGMGHDARTLRQQAMAAALQADPSLAALPPPKRPSWAPGTNLDAADVIRGFKADGGAVYFAHPFWLTDPGRGGSSAAQVWRHIEFMLELGVDGIEVFHPKNSIHTQALFDFCRARGLPVSGGSDSHGVGNIGRQPVEDWVLDTMRQQHAGKKNI